MKKRAIMFLMATVVAVSMININTVSVHAITQDEMVQMIEESCKERGISTDDVKTTGGTINDAELVNKLNEQDAQPTKAPESAPVEKEKPPVVEEVKETVEETTEEPTTIEQETTTEEITTTEEMTSTEEITTEEETTTEDVFEATEDNNNNKVKKILLWIAIVSLIVTGGTYLVVYIKYKP